MTTSRPSGSDAGGRPSEAFGLLHPSVQRWVWERRWRELRDAQERAVAPILAGDTDVIIAAATAFGKTEAAFLPILSALAADEPGAPGIRVLYISPLKALINDQYERLRELAERLEIPVHRWHGDVAASRKAAAMRDPAGVLLITPESLEALLVIQGPRAYRLLGALRYVVVDELHAFIGTERGAQLGSLLRRVELGARRRVPRISLSATLGEMRAAAAFLRPGEAERVRLIVSDEDAQELRLQLRGYLASSPRLTSKEADAAERAGQTVSVEDVTGGEKLEISEHLYRTLRGTDNLIFANSRERVELYADLLTRRAERERAPNEFFPHHGSLSKELRQHAESRLKDRELPVNVVCTSTLEMGLDIGSVASIVQLGAPPSVSSLRQRLGRSGRRGGAAVLRLYVSEGEVNERTPPSDALRAELVQSIAAVRLLLARWYEPPEPGDLHLSTLVQQLIALIAERGGLSAPEVYDALCGPGPFGAVDRRLFARLLRRMGETQLIMQMGDGTLLLGPAGERIASHYGFYAAFNTPEEYRLVCEGRTLGTLPIDHPLSAGARLVFGGRRWRVVSVDGARRVVELARSEAGRPPRFTGGYAPVHDRVRREMLAVYREDAAPAFLDATARDLLAEARENFRAYRLDERAALPWGTDTVLFLWAGDRVQNTVAVALAERGLHVGRDGLGVTVERTSPAELRGHLRAMAAEGPPDPVALAAGVENKEQEKYDWALRGRLLDEAYAARSLDTPGAWEGLRGALRRY